MSNKPSAEQYRKALSEFQRSVEVTRDVRFQAAIRLGLRQSASSYVVSILSLFVIALSIIPNIYKVEIYQTQILLGSSIILSAFVIFTSLIDGARNFYHQGELLHSCARKVATVYHELKNVDPEDCSDQKWKELRGLQDSYRKALDDCPVNHANVDFIRVQIRKPHHFNHDYTWKWKSAEIKYKKVEHFIETWLWITPHLIAIGTVFYVVYHFVLSKAPYMQ